jgi:competence protein ComEA
MKTQPDRDEARQTQAVIASPREDSVPGVTPTPQTWLGDSVWRPVLAKALSIGAGMLGLAAIGMFSTLREAESGQEPAQLGRAGLLDQASAWVGALAAAPASAATDPPATPAWSSADGPAFAVSIAASAEPLATDSAAPPATASSAAPTQSGAPAASTAPPASGTTPDGKVILNTANIAELDTLPGVGKKTAERIVELRTRLGRFKKTSDLLRIKGIGPRSLQKLAPFIVLDPPPAH